MTKAESMLEALINQKLVGFEIDGDDMELYVELDEVN